MYNNSKNRNFIGKRRNYSQNQNNSNVNGYYYQQQIRNLFKKDVSNSSYQKSNSDKSSEKYFSEQSNEKNFNNNNKNEHGSDFLAKYNYEICDSDENDTSSKLVIDESYTSTKNNQSSTDIAFPEQDMSVYDCSQLENGTKNNECPNRAVYSIDLMDLVLSQNVRDKNLTETKTKTIKNNVNDLYDPDITINNDSDNNSNEHSIKNNVNSKKFPIKITIKQNTLSTDDNAIIDKNRKSNSLLNINETKKLKESVTKVFEENRSLTPCLDEKSGSESGEICDVKDQDEGIPIKLSKNVINKIQVENDLVTDDMLEINAKDSEIHFMDTNYLLSFNNDRNKNDELVQFKKRNRNVHDRNYRDKVYKNNTIESVKKDNFRHNTRSRTPIASLTEKNSSNLKSHSSKRKHKHSKNRSSSTDTEQSKKKKKFNKKHRKHKRKRSQSRSRSSSRSRDRSSIAHSLHSSSSLIPMSHNIKVIVPNDRVYSKKSKRRDKKSKRNKSLDKYKKRKRHISPRLNSPPKLSESKQVYSAGNNIVISLTLDQNKNQVVNNDEIVDIKPIVDRYTPTSPPPTLNTKKKSKKSKNKSPKISTSRILNTNIDALRTLAIFDLEQSPVKQLTPPPVPIIELSDSDEEKDKSNNQLINEQISDNTKTPPTQSPLKQNAECTNNTEIEKENLLDENSANNDVINHENELEHRLNQALNRFQNIDSLQNKHIPPTPTSPDVYDPFEPTASPNSTNSIVDNKSTTILQCDTETVPREISYKSDDDKRLQESSNNEQLTNDKNQALDSPYSPGSSDFEDVYDPEAVKQVDLIKMNEKSASTNSTKILPTAASRKEYSDNPFVPKPQVTNPINLRLCEENLKILGQLPNVTVEKQVKDKYVKKLNRQERVIEEVKMVLKPQYVKKRITKDQYKEILRKSVPKICHNRSGEINPLKIQNLILAYVKKYRYLNKHGPQSMAATSSTQSPKN